MAVDTQDLNPDFAQRLYALIAASHGMVTITSGFRDHALQSSLFDAAVKKYGSPQAASQWVAAPGHSHHEQGIAADLGGDMQIAHQLAPQFGLYFPMSWENWHVEPVSTANPGTDPQAYTVSPHGDVNPTQQDRSQDPAFWAANLVHALTTSNDALNVGASDTSLPAADFSTKTPADAPAAGSGAASGAASMTADGSGSPEDRFLAFVRHHESGGNYQSPSGPGHWAGGAYQVMRDTWAGYGGYARADLAPPSVQDAFARQHLQGIISATGSQDPGVWAAAWYLGTGGAQSWIKGGMDPNFAPPENNGFKVSSYANEARAAVGNG